MKAKAKLVVLHKSRGMFEYSQINRQRRLLKYCYNVWNHIFIFIGVIKHLWPQWLEPGIHSLDLITAVRFYNVF